MQSSASPASVEKALFGDPNHSHSNQGVKEATPEWKTQLDSSDLLKLTLRGGPSALP
jgi:hypothetical protein